MCGFAGYWRFEANQTAVQLLDMVAPMAEVLNHRGPDDLGTWAEVDAGIAMGHRRLAILDLSSSGHQPMTSSTGRFVLSYNGEIYNHISIRAELNAQISDIAWRGHSDTETLLAAIEAWGLAAALQRCVGMFALALWDAHDKTLQLARDRFGEKPLYYGWSSRGAEGAFIFASELKALKAYPGFDAPVCRKALAQYLRFMYVPAPRSIYQGIFKLEPGCILQVTGSPSPDAPMQPLRPGQAYGSLTLLRWWSLDSAVKAGARKPFDNEYEALNCLETQLIESIGLQSLADVSLGAFLSGGVDSSTIVALMQRHSSRPVQTFTIGFDEVTFDESVHAQAVAKHLGTDHHELRVTAKMAQEVIPNLPWMYDEPFADSSQIPTHLVCRSAKQYVTVALSGDGADELFGGYNRYHWGPRVWSRLSLLPMPARKLLGSVLAAVPLSCWNTLGGNFLGSGDEIIRIGEKVHKLADRLSHVNDIDGLYRSLVSEWSDPASLVLDENGMSVIEPRSLLDDPLPIPLMEQPLPMMYRDSLTYLTDDILCKVDRAAMACSLETRVPFLDHRIVELAWRLPKHMKVRGNTSKWALRQVLYKHVPKELIERPKAGFAVPIGQWLRGPLRDWTESLLSENRLQKQGYFRPGPIRHAWLEHLSGQRDNTAKLWSVLMFQAWLEKNQ